MMRYIFGADIGGTRTKLGLTDIQMGIIISQSVIPTEGSSKESFLDAFSDCFESQLSKNGLNKDQIFGIGISIGSYIFPANGVVDTMGGFINIPDGYPLKDIIEERMELPCRIENDARLICYAESLFGAGKAYGRVLTLTLGTGVGVGFVVNKRFPDPDACNHLSGHLKVRSLGEIPVLDQEKCYCAVDGCLESTCSGTALQRYARSILGSNVTNEELFALAEAGDSGAKQIVDWYMTYLSIGLNQLIYVYAPDMIVLAGGVANSLEPYLDRIREQTTARIHSEYKCEITTSKLKESAGIIGAASLFLEE